MSSNRKLSRLQSRWIATLATTTVLIAGSVVGQAGPVAAAPPDGGPSAIARGGVSPLAEFTDTTLPSPQDTDIDPGQMQINPCARLAGTVTPEDIDRALGGSPPPKGDGHWEYALCGQDEASSRFLAQRHPTVADAKAFCQTDEETANLHKCVVVAQWKSNVPPAPPVAKNDRQSYIESYLQFAPDLGSSPAQDADHAAIANLPTWFWNTVETRFPKVVSNLAIIGDFAFATAWHLNTTFRTDGDKACDISGLTKVGTEWDAGRYKPDQESPSNCGHTYRNIGTYDVRGCSRWLIIAYIPPFFVIVFPITLCRTQTVRVKESQVVTSGGGPQGRVS
jgi:hypothetical protein